MLTNPKIKQHLSEANGWALDEGVNRVTRGTCTRLGRSEESIQSLKAASSDEGGDIDGGDENIYSGEEMLKFRQ